MRMREAVWMPMQRLHLRSVPDEVVSWLRDPGSLTQRLIDYCDGRFHVRLLQQLWRKPLESERQILKMATGEYALIREVELWCDSTPLVYARTVIPVTSMKGRVRGLSLLGNRPLGAVLFNDKSTRRELFEVAELGHSNYLYHHANHALVDSPKQLWGRRTRFRYAGERLLVHEIFLPALTGRQR